jgi:hypothetical protein
MTWLGSERPATERTQTFRPGKRESTQIIKLDDYMFVVHITRFELCKLTSSSSNNFSADHELLLTLHSALQSVQVWFTYGVNRNKGYDELFGRDSTRIRWRDGTGKIG